MNYSLRIILITSLLLIGLVTKAQNNESIWDGQKQLVVTDFEKSNSLSIIQEISSEVQIITKRGVTKGKKALKINFKEDIEFSGIEIKPRKPWDNKNLDNYCLVFEVTNLSDISVHLRASVNNVKGVGFSRGTSIAAGITKTCFFEIKGENVGIDRGLRDDPSPWVTEDNRMIIQGGKSSGDFSVISKLRISVKNQDNPKTVVIDNIRFVKNPEYNANYYKGIVDKFGQNNKVDFAIKVHSDKELKEIAEKELRELAVSKPMADRSLFGGWKNGPKLKGTGYFRTEKVGDKWAMVDPEGYLYFSTGIANARMANSTTFTGIDYKDESIKYRDPEDLTPEDSKNLVTLSKEVTNTAFRAYPKRADMFEGLPTYDDPLANHYSYRRESHKGPVPNGETYSFYQANLERRYGERYPGSYIVKWKDVTIDRMLDWGFTSFGNWAAEDFFQNKRIPYYANGWIIGDFKTMSSGYWGPMPDPFDPEFKRRAKQSIDVVADQVKNDPWCVGIFIDNEKAWGNIKSTQLRFHIVIDALKHNASALPMKREIVKMLKNKYNSVNEISKAWNVKIASWESFSEGVEVDKSKKFSKGLKDDLADMTVMYADKYFSIVNTALKEVLPNHMYMGVRFTKWGMTPEVRKAAVKYIDVFSINYYEETIGEKNWEFLKELDMPAIIGEYHIGALDSGYFNPGIIHASNQVDRARMYKRYTESVIDNPYFVGVHWFQYTDSPITGRAHDGENYNIGFVSSTDIPYPEMVKAAKEVHKNLYQRRFGNLKKD
ncbi:agarase [Lutibacter citreus]|uniref:agarase n=1 Tax=Lutibacter citreus TaxID=2138210 RepID=UPI000DBE8327|nr:agarase [Lutibacter citreus]